jgi:hypothetical protein
MPPADDLGDDFVADLLSKEAAECALKYSAMGMDAYTKSSKLVLSCLPFSSFARGDRELTQQNCNC